MWYIAPTCVITKIHLKDISNKPINTQYGLKYWHVATFISPLRYFWTPKSKSLVSWDLEVLLTAVNLGQDWRFEDEVKVLSTWSPCLIPLAGHRHGVNFSFVFCDKLSCRTTDIPGGQNQVFMISVVLLCHGTNINAEIQILMWRQTYVRFAM